MPTDQDGIYIYYHRTHEEDTNKQSRFTSEKISAEQGTVATVYMPQTLRIVGQVPLVVDKVKKIIKEKHGNSGFISLHTIMEMMDDKRISKKEFNNIMTDCGIRLNDILLDQLFVYFDRDNNNYIDIFEFESAMTYLKI